MPETKTKTVVSYDSELDLTVSIEVKRARKSDDKSPTKERYLGIMIEERHTLEKALLKKKMTFSELINFLNKR